MFLNFEYSSVDLKANNAEAGAGARPAQLAAIDGKYRTCRRRLNLTHLTTYSSSFSQRCDRGNGTALVKTSVAVNPDNPQLTIVNVLRVCWRYFLRLRLLRE